MFTRRARDFFRQVIVWFLLFCMFMNTASVTLAISDGQFIAGVGTINRDGNTVTITASDGTIINWGNFDISLDEIARFMQPGSNAAVLNKILSGAATHIDGTLLANGRIFIVNPAGVIFGAGAVINVSQLVASGLNIRNEDFINGRYEFYGGNGSVINHGNISAESVALIGKHVLNTGVITSRNGYVVMVAGDRVLLGQRRSNIVVEVDSVQVPDLTETGNIAGDVINDGTISASGGTIVLASGDIFSKALEGLDSLSVKVESGSGRVAQLGLLDADGTEGNGGNIVLSAGEVVSIGSDSLTTANAGADGDGGDILVYSPGTALLGAGAQIEVKGGSNSGNGGFVEVSGQQHVEIEGSVNASAQNGAAGTLLIDPTDITITDGPGDIDPGIVGIFTLSGNASTISNDAIETFLNNGTNVEITTDSLGSGTGNIVQNADAMINAPMPNGAASLKMTADNNIELNGGIWGNMLDVILDAGGNVDIGAIIITGGGNFVSSGVDFDNTGGPLVTSGGNVDLSAHTGIATIDTIHTLGGTSTGTVSVNGSSININNKITGKNDILLSSDGGDIGLWKLQAGGEIQIDSAGAIDDISGGTVTNLKAASMDLTAVTGIGQSGIVTSQAGVINASTTGSPAHISITNTGDVTLKDVSTINGNINIVNAGDIIVNKVMAIGSTVTINSTGVIKKGMFYIIAKDLVLEAVTGIGTNTFMVTSAETISAKTTGAAGGADIAIENFSPVIISNMSTVDGSVNISNKGNMRTGTISAGGAGNVSLSTVANNVDNSDIMVDKVMALDSTVTISSAGAIKKGTDFIAAKDLVLEAVTGIGTNSFMVTSADTISAKTTGAAGAADIDIENYKPVTISNMSTVDGSINITNKGNMRTGTISAGGAGNVSLTTVANGDVIVDNITAIDNTIAVNSSGAIRAGGAVDLTAATLLLTANTGIQGSSPIETSSTDITAATNAGTIEIANDNSSDSIASLTVSTGTGDILFSQTGGGKLEVSTATTADGSIAIDVDNADLTAAGAVTAGNLGNIELTASASTIRLEDNIDAGQNLVLNDNTDVAAGKLLKAGNDVTVADGKTLTGDGALTIDAAGTATFGGEIKTLTGDLDITGGTLIYAKENMTAAGNMFLHGNTRAADDVAFFTDAGDLTIDDGKTLIGEGLLIIDVLGTATFGGDVETLAGDLEITADTSIVAKGNITSSDSMFIYNDITVAADKILAAIDGDIFIDDGMFLTGLGALTVEAAGEIILGGDVQAAGNLTLNADSDLSGEGDIWAMGAITTTAGNIDIFASDSTIYLDDNVDAADDLLLNNNTEVAAGKTLKAGNDVTVADGKTLTGDGALTIDAAGTATFGGEIKTLAGDLDITAGTLIHAKENMTAADNMLLHGDTKVAAGKTITADGGNLIIDDGRNLTGEGSLIIYAMGTATLGGDVETLAGDLDITADTLIEAKGNMTAAGNMLIYGSLTAAVDKTLAAGNNLTIDDGMNLTGQGALTVTAGENVTLGGAVEVAGNLTLKADSDLSGSGTMWAKSTVTTTAGSIDISASDTTIVLDGDIDAAVDLLLNNNTEVAAGKMLMAGNNLTVAGGKTLTGDGALTIYAGGTVTLGGNVETLAGELKVTGASAGLAVDIKGTVDVAGGNADIEGTGDVQIGGDVASDVGGVSIVSNDGKIFTRDGITDDTLTVNITGSSDDMVGTGIENTGGRTAILIKSGDDLKLDSGTLTANGTYYDTVDDRAAIDFLEADIPAENKLAGNAIDVAIYLASTDGDVYVGSAIDNIGDNGVVAADAFGAVSYGAGFEASLTAGNIDHLEVSSRSALDYVDAGDNSLLLEPDAGWNVETYVWRGENPDAGTGAWVLEPPADSVPAAPVPVIRLSEIEGWEFDILGTALLAATAEELGIGVEDIQTRLANALFLSTDVQPYDILEQLIAAAKILRDGNGIAALGRVINEFVATPAPPTEEQMALIASALSNPDSGTYYAQAGDFIDAMVSYIGTLSEGLGWEQSDAVSFVMEKYGTAIAETGDASLAAYVQVRLANLGG